MLAAAQPSLAEPVAEPAAPAVANPLMKGADPHVQWFDGTCWIYATGLAGGPTQFYAAASKDLVKWETHGPVLDLKELPWVRADGREEAYAWAPCIIRKNGRFFFYFSVGPQRPGFPAHIGVASGDSPAGPFRDSGKALLTGGNGFEAIDPMVFHDPASGRDLLYAGGSAGARLRVFELGGDMVSLAGEIPVETPPKFTEGAFIHQHGGLYHLTYSHGRWRYHDYSVHHASARSPTGPWTYHGPVLTSNERHKGPGHHSVAVDPSTNERLVFYHRWDNADGEGPYPGSRQIAVDRLIHRPDGSIAPVVMDGMKR